MTRSTPPTPPAGSARSPWRRPTAAASKAASTCRRAIPTTPSNDTSSRTRQFASAPTATGLWRKAHGEGIEYLTIQRTRKSISRETTFGNDVTNEEELKRTLFYLTGKVAQSLRKKGWEASTVDIKLRYTDFQTLTRAKTIKPSDDDKVIFETAWDLMQRVRTRRVGVRLIGVGVTNFSLLNEQEFLFEDYEAKRKKMLRAVTRIRDKFGYESLLFGNTGEDKRLKGMENYFQV